MLSSLIHIILEIIVDIETIFLTKVPIGISDQRPLKAVTGKQSAEEETRRHDILLVLINNLTKLTD